MIDIIEFLHPDSILCRHPIGSKKKALETVSELLAAALPRDTGQAVFDALLKRERLGSTGLGSGIALPHGRVAALQSPLAAVVTLRAEIDFEALDGRPVDIVFALVIPENREDQHLQILAGIAAMCSDPSLSQALRQADSSAEIHQLLNDWQHRARST